MLTQLFSYKWESYRQAHSTFLDKEMLANSLCPTFPEECSGRHGHQVDISNGEFSMLWRLLVGKSPSHLNLLPFLEQYHTSVMVQDMMFPSGPPRGGGWDKMIHLYRNIEAELLKDPSIVANVRGLQFFATYRGNNHVTWSSVLARMPLLQSLELHFWVCSSFLEVLSSSDLRLRELILSRQRQGRASSSDLSCLPKLVQSQAASLRVLVVDSADIPFGREVARELQRAVSAISRLECLKLESEESPYVHWLNSRYLVNTKRLEMCLRKSDNYLTVIRNVNRCIVGQGLSIRLHFDTYCSIDNHKHAFFSQGPVLGGGENTVSQDIREFEEGEARGGSFFTLMQEFGPKVTTLSIETDIRPEYFIPLFPNVETVEMFSRCSRRVPLDPRVPSGASWSRLTDFTMEVDPGFCAASTEYLLVHVLGDLLPATPSLQVCKLLASQTGLRLNEDALLGVLHRARHTVSNLRELAILSPYQMGGQGLSCRVAAWFLQHCPALSLLRDVSSWAGSSQEWGTLEQEASARHLITCYAVKTQRVSLYTIDYDSEGWVQEDTGHHFELYNNLTEDWEVVQVDNVEVDEVEDVEMQDGGG